MKKVVNFRPALFLAMSIIFGILSFYYFLMGNLTVAIIMIVVPFVLLALTIIFSKENRKIYLIFSVIFLFVFVLSGLNFYIRIEKYNSTSIDYDEHVLTCKIIEIKEYESSERFILDCVEVVNDKNVKLDGKISLSVYGVTDFDIGDIVKFSSRLRRNSFVYENSFSSSNVAENVKYACSVDVNDIQKIGNSQTILESVHKFIRDSLKSGLSNQSFSIAYAMTLGNTDYMQEDLLSNFRALGVAHIFAVSGLHIGFFATFLALLFSKIKINRYLKLLITSLILFFYAGVCGFSASSVRSAIMTTVLLISESVGKKYDKLSSISFAGVVILIYSPVELFRVGFQLSFMVVLGLITSTRLFKRPLKFLGEKFSSLFAGVLSAQIFSIPICLIAFGGVSIISIIANLIVLPIIGLFYMFNFIATIIGGIFNISHITLYLSNLILEGVAFVVNIIDYKIFMVGGISIGIFALAYYLSFVFVAGYFNFKRITNLLFSIILMITCVAGCTILTVKDVNTTKGYVIADSNYMVYLTEVDKEGVLVVAKATSRFGNNRIIRASNKIRLDNIENVIFLNNDTETDVVQIVGKLYCDFEPKNIYYYKSAANENTKVYIERLYKGTKCFCIEGLEDFVADKFSFKYLQKGYGISLKYKDRTTNIFTTLSYDFDFDKNVSGECDLLIVSNYHEVLSYFYKTKKIVTFYPTLSFENGYLNGNLKVELN